MSLRGSFSRSVARAAASGGGRAYRSRRPSAWYATISIIVIVGLALIIYSRNENLNPKANPNAGPTSTSNWHEALGFDICGTIHPALAANTNLSTAGIRTFGDGLINVDPGAVTTPATYEGKSATLATFVKAYGAIDISPSVLYLNGKGDRLWQNGDVCTSKYGPARGKGQLEIKLWSSPTATGALVSSNPAKLALRNSQMIMIAFVPKGTKIPVPLSKDALLSALGEKVSGTTTSLAVETPTTLPGTATGVSGPTGVSGATTTSTAPASATGATATTTPKASVQVTPPATQSGTKTTTPKISVSENPPAPSTAKK